MINELKSFKIPRAVSALGMTSSRSLYWFYKQADGLNFGDWVGPYLFEQATGKKPYYFDARRRSIGSYFVGCGSIIGHIKHPRTAIVWGSGAIKPGIDFAEPKAIHAVRGPLTREICLSKGYSCPEVYGDPAILLPKYYQPSVTAKRYRLGLVPHFKDYSTIKKLFGDRDDINIIDVKQSVIAVVDEINECEAVISSSLHGIIVSHAYKIPVAWAVISNDIIGGRFKYDDYFLGAGLSERQEPVFIDKMAPQSTADLSYLAHSKGIAETSDLADRLLAACPY